MSRTAKTKIGFLENEASVNRPNSRKVAERPSELSVKGVDVPGLSASKLKMAAAFAAAQKTRARRVVWLSC